MRFNQRSSAHHPQGGRLQIGIGGRIAPERVAGFASESVADFKSEPVADFPRNPHVLDGTPLIGNKSQFFRTSFHYGPTFPQAPGIRPTLQVEMTFSGSHLPPVSKQVQSLLGRTLNATPEVAAVDCIDPIETAADKLSALAWRTASRDRSAEDDDPSIVRHLHDLAALASLTASNADFPRLALMVAQADAPRAGRSMGGRQLLEAMLPAITGDPAWRREYEQFVVAVSFGPRGEWIGFDQAVAACAELVERVLQQ